MINQPFPNNLRIIINNYVNPLEEIFKSHNLYEPFKELIALLQNHGYVHSLAIRGRDAELYSLYEVQNDLIKISLAEHTYTVTINLTMEVISQYSDYEVHLPRAIITGLAHDIGKIPNLFSSAQEYDHSIISSMKTAELLSNTDNAISTQILGAIRGHHLNAQPNGDNILTVLLQRADKNARIMELLSLNPNYKVLPIQLWLGIEDFYNRLEPYINCVSQNTKWDAISHNGYIYCKPKLIHEIANMIYLDKNILDLNFIDDTKQEDVRRQIVNYLRLYGLVDNVHTYEKYGTKFNVITGVSSKSHYLTKLRPIGFFSMNQLEARKGYYLQSIKKISIS